MLLSQVLSLSEASNIVTIPGYTSVLSAVEKLRENDFVPVLIESGAQDSAPSPRAVSGYSLVSKLSRLNPSQLGAYLESPASESALAIGSVDVDEDLVSLLHVFEATTLGFAEVHGNNKKVILFVRSLLKLYESGILSSNLVLDDVASSPLFSLSRGTKLEQALREMIDRKFRRVQIAGTRVMISDREILSYLFGPDKLQRARKSSERFLDGTLEEIDASEPPWLDGRANLKNAARLLFSKTYDTVMTDRGIITPWDLIIKPWRLGELKVES